MRLVDICLAIMVAMIWGLGFTFSKAALGEFPPILLMALRFTLTALVLVWFVRPPIGLMGRVFAISLVSAGVQYALTFTGLKGLDASTAIIIVQLEAPLAAIAAWFMLKDPIGWRRGFGMVLAFSGVVLLAGEPSVQNSAISALLVLGGATTFACGQVMIKALKGAVGGFTLVAWVAVFAVPQLWVLTFVFEENHWTEIQNASALVWGVIAYLGLIMTAFAYGIWYRLISRYSINYVMPFTLLLPLTTIIGAVLLLGETLKPLVMFGGALTIVGVGIIVVRRDLFAPKSVN